MKRTAQAVQTDIPDNKRKPVKYTSNSDEVESDENTSGGKSSSVLMPPNPNTRAPGTAGKQPVSTGSSNPKNTPQRPNTAGKQPNTTNKPGTGGKQPDSEKIIQSQHAKRNAAAAGNNKPSTTGKGSGNNTNSRTQSESQTVKPGTGGKEPNQVQNRYQPSSNLSHHSLSKAQGGKSRPQTPRKQHPLIGKAVKVFYVPEGYFMGVVKSQLRDSEFLIHWDDGSQTSAVLREDDETEDTDNEDRWSIVEDFEANERTKEKLGGNGNKIKSKPTSLPKQPAAPPPQQQRPALYAEDDDDNDDPENDNPNDDNEQDDT